MYVFLINEDDPQRAENIIVIKLILNKQSTLFNSYFIENKAYVLWSLDYVHSFKTT